MALYGETLPAYDQAEREASPEIQQVLAELEPCIGVAERVKTLLNGEFPSNTETRKDVVFPKGVVVQSEIADLPDVDGPSIAWNAKRLIKPHEEETFYAFGAEVGVGRGPDIALRDVGMPANSLLVCEGGRVDTKGTSQMLLALEGAFLAGKTDPRGPEDQPTGSIVQCATRHRTTKEEELAAMTATAAAFEHLEGPQAEQKRALLRQLGVDPAHPTTEWDGLMMMWVTHPDFVPNEQAMHIRTFDVNGAESFEGGRLISIGSLHGRQIFAQEVPRADQVDAQTGEVIRSSSGKAKYVQPNAATLAVSLLESLGGRHAAVVTSATYLLEHIVETAKVKWQMARNGVTDMTVRPIAYGTNRMKAITGAEPKRPKLGHMLGAIGKAYRQAVELRAQILADGLGISEG